MTGLTGICAMLVLTLAQSTEVPNVQELPLALNARKAIAGELDIRNENECYKWLINMMRSEALPRELRLRLAYKVLEGDLPEKGIAMHSGRLMGLSNAALLTLGRLEDAHAIAFLEQKLPLWEKTAQISSAEQPQSPRVVPDVLQARITLARLRAVRAIPLRSGSDVRERFHKMLEDLRIPPEEWSSLMREAKENPKVFDEVLLEVGSDRHERFWRARVLLKEYAQMLLQARTQGFDVSELLAEYPFESTDLACAYANLARMPNETRLQQVVRQAFQWRVMNTENAAYAQYLLDYADRSAPIIIDAVLSLTDPPEQGIGLGVLSQILETAVVLGCVENTLLEDRLSQSSNQQAQRFIQRVRGQVSQRQVQVFMSSF